MPVFDLLDVCHVFLRLNDTFVNELSFLQAAFKMSSTSKFPFYTLTKGSNKQ